MKHNYSPKNPRSVHGGEDSHLAVEVSPVLQDSEGCRAMPHAPQLANMVSVYIRNPMAFHIMDIPRASGWPDQQQAEAFAYADALAEHLGCEVVSAIPRPDVAPAAPEPISLADMMEAAACLWEAVLERKARAKHDQIGVVRAFEALGTAALRMQVIGWAEHVHRDWEEAKRLTGYDAPFDWEFCPDWLALNITFDEHGATMVLPRNLPTMSQPPMALDDALHGLLIDQMGMVREHIGGGAIILRHTFGNDWSVSVSCLDGGGLPSPDNWQVGVFQPVNDGTPTWEHRSDDTHPIMKLQQAIGAAWAIGGDA